MAVQTLARPQKVEQAAALMLTVFKANPNTVMKRWEVEALVNVAEFSLSTRQRALSHLIFTGHIRWEWEGNAINYWMPV